MHIPEKYRINKFGKAENETVRFQDSANAENVRLREAGLTKAEKSFALCRLGLSKARLSKAPKAA